MEPIGRGVFAARKRGLLLRPGRDWDRLAPPLCTTTAEADEIAAVLEAAIADADW